MSKKLVLASLSIIFAIGVTGCAHHPDRAGRIHLITHQEAVENQCTQLSYAGSASGILINGKARNTSVIVKKALKVPGATHISYTKGEAGYAFTKANIWRCPNPNMISHDPKTLQMARDYIGHE